MILCEGFTMDCLASKDIKLLDGLKPRLPGLAALLKQACRENRDPINQLGADPKDSFDSTPDSGNRQTRLLRVAPVDCSLKRESEGFTLTSELIERLKVLSDPSSIVGHN